jgi:Mlc titration factor MtfA (ptsG expression regulator)
VLPLFGFPEWDWHQISEILIYPSRFDEEFQFDEGADQRTLGMVGSGAMNRLMILSKPGLFSGFRNPRDARNVGMKEFAHLVDKSDGVVDGLPGVGLGLEVSGQAFADYVREHILLPPDIIKKRHLVADRYHPTG